MKHIDIEESQRIAASSVAAVRREKAAQEAVVGQDFIDCDLVDALSLAQPAREDSRTPRKQVYERCRFWFSELGPCAKFENEAFTSCDFHGASFERADVFECSFADSRFCHADLGEAAFSFCDFRDARLFDADLRGARFKRCDLRGADFSGADLQGAHFENCLISEKAFDYAKGESLSPTADKKTAKLFAGRKRAAKRVAAAQNAAPAPVTGNNPISRLQQLQTSPTAGLR